MPRLFLLRPIIAVFAASASYATAGGAQAAPTVRLRVAIVGPNLDVKPVPLHTLHFIQRDTVRVEVRTSLDGTVDAQVPAGPYLLRSGAPVAVNGVRYSWEVAVAITPGPATLIELTNLNATVDSAGSVGMGASTRSEMAIYGAIRTGVVRVVNGLSHGSGFFVDSAGLIATNAHVVQGVTAVDVFPDSNLRVRAEVVERDNEADLAVLRLHPTLVEGRWVFRLADTAQGAPLAVAGERLFAIGYPLSQERTLTMGVASSIREGAIISDVNINHGNSGGPLVTLDGIAVAVNTFGDFSREGGPGVSGSVVITRLLPLLEKARGRLAEPPPRQDQLPVPPSTRFALQTLKTHAESAELRDYLRYDSISIGRFIVEVRTPPISYVARRWFEQEVGRDRKKREAQAGVSDAERYSELEGARDWEQYVGDGRLPIVALAVRPKLGETTGSVFRRLLVTGVSGKATIRYSADLRDAKIYRNQEEIVPFRGGHTPVKRFVDNAWVDLKDVADYGYYLLPMEAFEPMNDGAPPRIFLVLEDLKNPTEPSCGELPRDVVAGIWNDFELLFKQNGQAESFRRADPSKKAPKVETRAYCRFDPPPASSVKPF